MRQRAATGWAGAGLAILITVTASGCDHIRAVASAAGRCAIVALRSIRVGSQPAAMVITPDGKRGYVANANSRFVTPIRLATSTALPRVRVTTPGGGTEAIVASPDGTIVYAATETFTAGGRLIGRVVPIRAATGRPLRPIRAGHFPIGLAITPDGKTIYVLDWNPASGPGSVIPIRTATRAALPPIRAGPVDDIDDIVMAPDGRTVYVTNFDANTVTPIRTVGNRALKPIKVGGGPNQIAITPDGSMAYVTTDDGVTPIRLATGTPLRRVQVKGRPFAVAVTPDSRTAYIAGLSSTARRPGAVTPIRVRSGTALKPIPVGVAPAAVAVSPDGQTIFVANRDSNTITPIRVAGNKALKPVRTRPQPYALTFAPGGRTVYVVDYTADDGPGYITPVRTCHRR